jgi:putative aldouronate transport system substrate-binding protein
MMKRFVVLLVVLVAGLAQIFAGGANETGEAAEEMTLQIYVDENAVWAEQSKLHQEIEQAFGVRLEPVIRPGLDQKGWYALKIAAGELFDYVTSGGLHFAEYDEYIKQGVAIELDETMIRSNMPNLISYFDRYDHLWDNDTFKWYRRDGKIYTIPQARPDDATRNVLGFRQDWLDRLGLKVPTTLQELETVLKAFTENDPDGNGKNDTYGYTGVNWIDYSLAFVTGAFGVYPGQWYINGAGQLEFGDVAPKYKEALAWIQKWYQAGYIDPELLTVGDWAIYKNKMVSSVAGVAAANYQVFQFPDDGWFYADLLKVNPNAKYTISSGIKGPYGDQGLLQFNPITYAGVMFTPQVENQPEKIEKYMQVFDALGFDEAWRIKQSWGYEGETWKLNAQGGYEWAPPYDRMGESENLKVELAEKYGVGPVGAMRAGFGWTWEFWSDPAANAKILYDPAKAALDAKGIEIATNGKYNIMGMAPVQLDTMKQYGETLDAIYNDYIVGIITGKRPVSDFDVFVREWKAAGGDKVLAEAQQVYDKYLSF